MCDDSDVQAYEAGAIAATLGEPATQSTEDVRTRLLALINANWSTQVLATAARLRLADRLAGDALSSEKLAEATGCHPGALRRLLRSLVTLDVVAEQEDGCFALGVLGEHLKADASDGLVAWAEFCGSRSWQSWQHLFDCVRTGRCAQELHGGDAGLGHLDEDPEAAALFHRAMASLTHAVAKEVGRKLSFNGIGLAIDVGGGTAELMSVLLRDHRGLHGILLDRPHAADLARERLREAGVADRCRFLDGDFFGTIPNDGDLYLLKNVLHDWDEDRAAAILVRIRIAMKASARLAVIERLMPERLVVSNADRAIARSDLNMLVGTGGIERTEAGYRDLLAAAGLQAVAVEPLVDRFSVIEAIPAP